MPLHRHPCLWVLALLIGWLPDLHNSAHAQAFTTAESIQVYACRATSSLLLYRGEGFQQAHLQRLESDLRALKEAVDNIPNPRSDLRSLHLALENTLREAANFGREEEDVPWNWTLRMSKVLRDILHAARNQEDADIHAELPAKVEYLVVQYLSRAYVGSFETAREQPDTYLGQDERQLVPLIDAELASLDERSNPALAKLKTRWSFLKGALEDMNSGNNSFNTASGRPFAPIMVDRHARALSNQWIALSR